jgi:GntR family transcriptional repressor for pyruvate dehydrogenase complex
MPTQLRRETLAEQVADGLIASIEDDALAPGAMLPSEASLAQEFGVSRPVVREALKVLAAKGVVAIVNGKGAIVRPISSDPLQEYFLRALRIRHATMVDLLEVRRGIEVECATLAAQRRTTAQLAQLEQTLVAMRDNLADRDEYLRIDIEFHLLVAAASQNTLLFHLVESMREPMRDSMRAVSRRRVTAQQDAFAVIAHANIVNAIAAGDAAGAGRAMAVHFDEGIRLLSQDKSDTTEE